MNNKELQALRKLLMLEVAEAAEFVGKVNVRSWQYWEAGRSAVPYDVETEMLDLESIRDHHINALLKTTEEGAHINLPYFSNFEDYTSNPTTPDEQKNVLSWRINQSVAAYFYAEGLADLI